MPRIPEFFETLNKISELHEAKNQDYATDADPFSNFRFTEYVLDQFPSNRDKSFVWPIANKLSRLATLLSSGSKPNFESIEDSFDDIATYVILWKCDVLRDKREANMQRIAAQEPSTVGTLGRLNYAGQSDEGKPTRVADVHDSKRGTVSAHQRVQDAPDLGRR